VQVLDQNKQSDIATITIMKVAESGGLHLGYLKISVQQEILPSMLKINSRSLVSQPPADEASNGPKRSHSHNIAQHQ
jgi:hypothetical protein